MPMEQNRAAYLQALLSQRNQLNASDNAMLNPSIDNDLENQALLNTNFNRKQSVKDIEQPKEEKQEVGSDNWFVNIVNKVGGFLDNLGHSFLEGVGGAFEGIIDLGANIIGAIGEGTGWYDSSPFDKFVEHNYAKDFADWNMNAFSNLIGVRGMTNLIRNSANYGGDFWQDMATGKAYDNEKYANGYLGGNVNRNVENGFEEFAMGVSQSIGFMLPTIVTAGAGGLSAASKTGEAISIAKAAANAGKVAQNLSLLQMGLSAAGKGAEEALNEGATTSQALGYGAISGTIEVISEKLVGGVLDKLGIGEGLFGGLVGKAGGKKTIGRFIGNMFNEGAEEVFSAVLEPFTKAIYKGSDSLEQLKSSDFWIGANGKFNESVLGQFTSGAVTAGVMGGINTGALIKEVGIDNYRVINKYQEMIETTDAYLKEKNETKRKQLADKYGKLVMEFEDLTAKSIAQSETEKLKRTAEIITSPQEMMKLYKIEDAEQFDKALREHIDFIKNQTNTIEKGGVRNYFNDLQRRYGTDATIEFQKLDSKAEGYYDEKNNKVVINENVLKEQGGALLAHEYFTHTLGQNMSAGTRVTLYNEIVKTDYYKKHQKALIDAYQINDDTYKSLDSKAKKDAYYQEEVIAKYLQNVFSKGTVAEQIQSLENVFSKPTMIDRILKLFNKSAKFKADAIAKEYAKVINKTIDALLKSKTRNAVLRVILKEKNNVELTANEESIKKEYKNLFDILKTNKPKVDMAYSKNIAPRSNYIVTNIKQNYNNYINENPNFSGEVFYSSGMIVLANSYEGDITISEKFSLGEMSDDELNYIYNIFERGVSYSARQFIGRIRQGIREIGKYRRGNKNNGVSRFSDSRKESVGQNDGTIRQGINEDTSKKNRGNNGNNEIKLSKNLDYLEADEEFEKWMDDFLFNEFDKELNKELGIEDVSVEEDLKPLDEIVNEEEITEEKAFEKRTESYEEFVERINDNLSPEVQDFFKDSVIKSNRFWWFDGEKDCKYIIPMFHGTPNSDMYYFDSKRIGTNGTVRGFGFYLTDEYGLAESYIEEKGKVITAFVNITKPMSEVKVTVSREQVKEFITKYIDIDSDLMNSTEYDPRNNYDRALNRYLNILFDSNGNDVDIIDEMYINSNQDYDTFFDNVTKHFGFDGIVYKNRAEGTIVVAFRSNQIKDITNVKPTKESPDIRYSKAILEDSDGMDLTKEQQKWNEDNKFVDEEDRVLRLYHASDMAGFMEFRDDKPIFLTPSLDNAYAYGGNYNMVNTTRYTNVNDLINDFYENYSENDYYQDLFKISDDEDAQNYVKAKIKAFEDSLKDYNDERTQEFIKNRIKWLKQALKDGYLATTEDGEGNTIFGNDEELLKEFQVQNQYNKNVENYDMDADETDNETGNRIYELYAKSTNPLIIECRGNNFLNIRYKGETLSTDEIAQRVKDEGKYDGIIFKNIMDNGQYDRFNSLGVSDVYVVFNPNQVKSVDNPSPTESNDIRYSKSLNNEEKVTDLSQGKNEVGKPKVKATPNTYKSVETTKDLIELLESRIAGNGYNLVYPKNYRDFMDRTFAQLNKVRNIDKTTDRIINLLRETSIEYLNEETKQYEPVGKLGDKGIVTDAQWQSLRNDVKRMIQYAPETEANNKYTLKFEQRLDKIIEKANEYKARIGRTKVLKNKITNIRKATNRFVEITENEVAKNGLTTLLKPFANLTGTDGYKIGTLKQDINTVLEWYNQDTIEENFESLPYNPKIRDMLEDLYEDLGEKGSLSTDEINKVIKIIDEIHSDIKKQIKVNTTNRAYARATMDKIRARKETKGIAKILKMWKRGFAPSYTVLREMLGGNSSFARLLTTDVQNATNNGIMYKGKYYDAIKAKMKELGIKDRQLHKKIEVNGLTMTTDQALYLWISLNTDINYKEIDANGFEYISDNKLSQTYGKGEAELYKNELEKILPKEIRSLGTYLQETMNGDIKQDYINWYESRYGKYEGRNELGKIGDTTYWMLNRSYQFATSAEKVVKAPAAVFKHSISRIDSNNAVMLGSAVSSVTSYIDALANEIYLKPTYRQAYQILNTKIGNTTIYKELQKLDIKDVNYLKTTLNDMIGVVESKQDLLTKMMSAFSVAKLSLNIGSMLKQFASIYTSNIPLRKSIKATLTRMFNKEAKAEFRKLVDEIGGLKYRESNGAVIKANAGNVSGYVENIAEAGMIGIKLNDYFTVGLGVYSLMQIGQDQYGFKIGTQENIDFVKEHWTEFELSQIGNNALSKNAISRGDYGTLARAIFSFMQGANRAAFGSQINKIGLWRRNHNVNEADLKAKINEAKENIEVIRNKNLDANGNFDEMNMTDEDRAYYEKYNADLMDAQDALKDYQEYIIAGGKAIPVNLTAGLIAQGVFVALVTELMKHLKGKKDWDEWDIADLGTNTLLSAFVDWIPFVNVIENMIKGYDIQIPAVEVLNEITDIITSGKNQNWQTMIRQIALLVGDTTGIPFTTLYEYAYGVVKSFNPEIAYNMNSVLYGTNIQSASKSLNKYVENKNTSKAQSMMNVMMDNFKVKSNDAVNKELTNLYMNGYTNVLPKSYMTEYTDDEGNKVTLTAKQITAFRSYYNESTKAVNNLINITEYRNMTNEEQAKIIKKIYDAYYSYAKAKILKINADSKIGNYLLFSKQNANLSHFMPILSRISTITDSKTKTRKELVFDYINKLKGFSKAEKLLMLYFSGYSSVSNETQLKIYLKQKLGFTNSELKEFLG